jgi:hypothetical protein
VGSDRDIGLRNVDAASEEDVKSSVRARYVRVTFPEPGKILLKIGPGDHSVQVFEISEADLRGIVRDVIPQILR